MQSIEKLKAERLQQLEALTPVEVAKGALLKGTDFLLGGEQEFTALVTKSAARQFPNLSPAQAFSKLFAAQSEEGKLLRQAFAAIKNMPQVMEVTPVYVGGAEARAVSWS